MTEQKSTRERILDSALNIFSRKGYHDTKVDEIVSDSHTSKGSIYLHFPNKEKLFLALVDQFADLIERNVRDSIEQEAGIERVRVALESVLNTFAKYRRPAKLLLVQAVGLGTVFENKRMEVMDRFAELIRIYLQEAIELGDIAPVDNVDVVSHAWMGAIYSVVTHWVYTGEPDKAVIIGTLLPLLLKSVGYEAK